MIYDVNYFISKFEKIPEEMWCVGSYEDNGRHCVNGQCGVKLILGKGYITTIESISLFEIFKNYPVIDLFFLQNWREHTPSNKISSVAAMISDGNTLEYPQPTPKQRILAALYDIKKLQEGEVKVEPKPKVTHHYVSVPEPLKKELVTLN